MSSVRLFLVILFLPLVVFGRNYKTGIDVNFSGTQGVDYEFEQFYYNRQICDDRVIYIKSGTNITAAHNAYNVKSQGTLLTGAEANNGTIRYKVDQEGRADDAFRYSYGSQPQLTGTLNFGNMTYYDTSAVLGSTGDNGGDRGTWDGSYWTKGLLDSVGDEWHTFLVWDDDGWLSAAEEYKSSDGFYHLFVVNPKTPILKWAVTGSGKFYTTPAKKYWIPKIYDQTTYAEGTFTVTIKDINGNNVFYRVNGGSFTDAGSSSVTLNQTNFNTGSNTLEYYYNATYIKTRTIVKDPGFPSAAESHGNMLWGSDTMWADIADRANDSAYTDTFARLEYDNNFQDQDNWGDWAYGSGFRNAPKKGFNNAFVAKLRGNDYSEQIRNGTGSSKSYAQFSKEMLIDSAMNIPNVGREMNWPGQAIPAKEIYYRGYYDVDEIYSMALSYDVLIAQYRNDQHSDGITPVEDYFVRDRMARFAEECLSYSSKPGATGGMWTSARQMGAIAIGIAMPTYNTEYYGTSGFDDATSAAYYDCPFPAQQITWKTFLIGDRTSFSLPGAPDMEYPGVSIAGQGGIYTGVIRSDADWNEKSGYFEFNLMRHCYEITANLLSVHYQSILSDASNQFKTMMDCFAKATAGTLTMYQSGGQPTIYNQKRAMFLEMNYGFPSIATQTQIDWILNTATGNETRAEQIFDAKALGIIFFDKDLITDPPAGAVVNAPSFNPPAGVYSSSQDVIISSSTPGATIRYTTDGSTPSSTVGTVYSGPVTIASTATLKAIAYNGVDTDSTVTTGVYTISTTQLTAPTWDLSDGAWMEPQTVTLTVDGNAETTYYTTDGSTPDTGDTVYSGAFLVSATSQLRAYSVAAGYTESGVGTLDIDINERDLPSLSVFHEMTIPDIQSSVTVTFDLQLESGTGFNLVWGFGPSAVNFYFTDYAPVMRINAAVFQAYNSGYGAESALASSSGGLYHISMVIDHGAQTYSATVTPDGGSTYTIATDYSYRAPPSGSLTRFVAWSDVSPNGTFSNFNIGSTVPPVTGLMLDVQSVVVGE